MKTTRLLLLFVAGFLVALEGCSSYGSPFNSSPPSRYGYGSPYPRNSGYGNNRGNVNYGNYGGNGGNGGYGGYSNKGYYGYGGNGNYGQDRRHRDNDGDD